MVKPLLIEMRKRFGGYLPIVVDCETGGCDAKRDALLELAAVSLRYVDNVISTADVWHYHVQPFEGAKITTESLEVTQIKPYHPFRFALPEQRVLNDLSEQIHAQVQQSGCRRAILVGHNAQFDLAFMQAAYARIGKLKECPFHRFTTLDTATMSAVFYQETVLAKAVRRAKIKFDITQAHSALYDAKITAELFCKMISQADQVFLAKSP